MRTLQVVVRYHPDEVERFIELADCVEDALPQVRVRGGEWGVQAVVEGLEACKDWVRAC